MLLARHYDPWEFHYYELAPQIAYTVFANNKNALGSILETNRSGVEFRGAQYRQFLSMEIFNE
jgi:hypothetical protein